VTGRKIVLEAAIPADLLDKIYARENWTRLEGEVRSRRAKDAGWVFSRNNRRGVYTATRNGCDPINWTRLIVVTLTLAFWAAVFGRTCAQMVAV
jgi:hypothetical protein